MGESSSAERSSTGDAAQLRVGDLHATTVGAMVHGGHALAHVGNHTVFVRYACPGEQVTILITSISRKIIRADAVEIHVSSPDRVTPSCELARPGGCGGCDWQYASIEAQRRWKSEVIKESFDRHGNLPGMNVVVEAVAGDVDGLAWRHRAHMSLVDRGKDAHPAPAFALHRSSDRVTFDVCPIVTPGINVAAHQCAPGGGSAWLQEGSDGYVAVAETQHRSSGKVRHVVRGREWRIAPDSFWQAHIGMADALVSAVLSSVEECVGDTRNGVWWDLYAGSGLFSAFLAEVVGESGRVSAVEESATSIREARRALHDLPQVRLHNSSVEDWVTSVHGEDIGGHVPDGVLLDPPRTGAGELVIRAIASAGPATIIYVACDPVALARDSAHLAAEGYLLRAVRGFDGFPMTHHVECVATFTKTEIS